jgi:hypothetical protein
MAIFRGVDGRTWGVYCGNKKLFHPQHGGEASWRFFEGLLSVEVRLGLIEFEEIAGYALNVIGNTNKDYDRSRVF